MEIVANRAVGERLKHSQVTHLPAFDFLHSLQMFMPCPFGVVNVCVLTAWKCHHRWLIGKSFASEQIALFKWMFAYGSKCEAIAFQTKLRRPCLPFSCRSKASNQSSNKYSVLHWHKSTNTRLICFFFSFSYFIFNFYRSLLFRKFSHFKNK